MMVVYNAESFLKDSIDSILRQSFKDFEFIIIDDGSTDRTIEILHSYNDDRIVFYEHKHDYIASLNLGLSLCKGRYIARMDADDISHPDRFRIQYAIMEAEPSIDICGSWMYGFKDSIRNGVLFSKLSGLIEQPLRILFEKNLFYHPTMFFRRSFFVANNLSYQEYPYAEDYKLWFEAAKKGAVFYVEPQPLYYYRNNETQVSVIRRREQFQTKTLIQKEILEYLLSRSNYRNILTVSYNNQMNLVNNGLLSYNTLFSFFRIIFNESDRDVYLETSIQ